MTFRTREQDGFKSPGTLALPTRTQRFRSYRDSEMALMGGVEWKWRGEVVGVESVNLPECVLYHWQPDNTQKFLHFAEVEWAWVWLSHFFEDGVRRAKAKVPNYLVVFEDSDPDYRGYVRGLSSPQSVTLEFEWRRGDLELLVFPYYGIFNKIVEDEATAMLGLFDAHLGDVDDFSLFEAIQLSEVMSPLGAVDWEVVR